MADRETSDSEAQGLDQPLKGVVVCTTSLSADHRADVQDKTMQLGGILKFDLTPDATHLLVGDYNTPKYRHVAKERPDIKVMAPRWIDAIMELWTSDAPINMAQLEEEWLLKPLQAGGCPPGTPLDRPRPALLCCMTGFNDVPERQRIVAMIESNGGSYTGDLSRQVTHLIVNRPEARKYEAAKEWKVTVVSIEWLTQTCERGLILDERLFDPLLPPEQRGIGAWTREKPKRNSLGKRSRSIAESTTEDGQRKMRRTASIRLGHQTKNMWDDILQKQLPPPETTRAESDGNESERTVRVGEAPRKSGSRADEQTSRAMPAAGSGVFSTSSFWVHGFNPAQHGILEQVLMSLGGTICTSIEELARARVPADNWNRFLVVRQTMPTQEIPDTAKYPKVQVVTEFFVEKCLRHKVLFDPNESVMGRPFPVFPIPGFEKHSICSSGFQDVGLLHVEKSISQLGGTYEPRLSRRSTVLIAESPATIRAEKRAYALEHGIPMVSNHWLWESVATGRCLPVEGYMFPDLGQKVRPRTVVNKFEELNALRPSRSEPDMRRTAVATVAAAPPQNPGVDRTAFEGELPAAASVRRPESRRGAKNTSDASTHFETAKTHQEDSFGGGNVAGAVPLGEVSDAALNRSPSPRKPVTTRDRETRADMASNFGREQRTTTTAATMTVRKGAVKDEESTPSVAVVTDARQTSEGTAKEAAVKIRKSSRTDDEKAAERQLLGSKLTHLIDSATTPGSAGGGDIPGEADSAASGGGPGPRRERRKREIFGRAVSNMSAGSCASLDSEGRTATTAGAAAPNRRGDAKAGRAADAMEFALSGVEAEAEAADAAQAPPPATQLEWRDPSAEKYRESVMRRLQSAGDAIEGSAARRLSGEGGDAHSTRRQTRSRA